MSKAKICDILGIRYPILQGAMGWVSFAPLVAAVSEAGGLGILAAAFQPAERVREEIRQIRSLTDKPFGVNMSMQAPNIDEITDILIEEGVKVVTTGAGSPLPYMERWNAAGIKVIPVIPNVKLAQKMQAAGATAVVAEGMESGGHVGDTTSMALWPQVVDAVDIPVIAAGGIADGRGIAAAMLMGASAVQLGTVFMATTECPIADSFKKAIVNACDTDTLVVGKYVRHPMRVLKNPWSLKFAELEGGEIRDEAVKAAMNQHSAGALLRAVRGDAENGNLLCGQIAGLVEEILPCRVLIEKLMREARAVLKNAPGLL